MILWCQAHLSSLYGVLELFTLLGEELFYMALMPLIYWCWHRATGLRLLAVISLSSYTNALLKWCLHSPRPYWYEPAVEGLRGEDSFGPPSGHSQNAVTFWGYIAATIRRYRDWKWVWPAFVVLAFLISFSRMLLGVHFPHGLLLGWTAGGIFLFVFWKFAPRFEAWFQQLGTAEAVLASVAGSLGMLLLAVMLGPALAAANPLDPTLIANAAADQPDKSIYPFSLMGPVSFAAVLGGLGVGATLMRRTASFSSGGSYGLRAARYLVGMVGLIAIYASGKLVPADAGCTAEVAFRYLRYFAMMLWAIWLAPLLFLKLKLAAPAGAGDES